MKKRYSRLFDKPQSGLKVESLFTREGKKVDISGDKWNLPYVICANATLNFGKICEPSIRESLKIYVAHRLKRISTSAGLKVFFDVWRTVLRHWGKEVVCGGSESHLIKLFETAISRERSRKKLWLMYEPIKWYIWSSDKHPENGFSEAYAAELRAMVIPGSIKGEAVRMLDPEMGPLNRSLELPLLIAALDADKSENFEHFQQKAVMALSLAFGRNPANLTYLREADLVKLDPENVDPCFMIRMPRIKKRQINPRDDLMDEYLDPKFGRIIEALVYHNSKIRLKFEGRDYSTPKERPLFIKQNTNSVAVRSRDIGNVFNMASADISNLISGFVTRHNIISPLTGKLMYVTPRRLRYTLATGLAAEGISKRELARILDHTDTQYVGVYFDVSGRIVEHLDRAAAKGFSKYLEFFNGRLIDNDEDAVNGEREDKHLRYLDEQNPPAQAEIGVCGESSACHLDPPYSCYLCPKFQPYRHADHEYVLDSLLAGREERLKKYENARLGIQLDEVIAAVAQVVKLCEEGGRNV